MNYQEVNKELLQFLDHSPNAFYAVANMQKELEDAGFTRLYEGCPCCPEVMATT